MKLLRWIPILATDGYWCNENVLECEKEFLESFGYTVLTALSGSKGLELASIHSVDVVIVDYFMPEMDGRHVAMEMRRLRPQAPIIMLSGAVEAPKQVLQCVDAFIGKEHLASQLLPAIAQFSSEGPCAFRHSIRVSLLTVMISAP